MLAILTANILTYTRMLFLWERVYYVALAAWNSLLSTASAFGVLGVKA